MSDKLSEIIAGELHAMHGNYTNNNSGSGQPRFAWNRQPKTLQLLRPLQPIIDLIAEMWNLEEALRESG
jgi:hypothetical protein